MKPYSVSLWVRHNTRISGKHVVLDTFQYDLLSHRNTGVGFPFRAQAANCVTGKVSLRSLTTNKVNLGAKVNPI